MSVYVPRSIERLLLNQGLSSHSIAGRARKTIHGTNENGLRFLRG
jgi:hypothetical protein